MDISSHCVIIIDYYMAFFILHVISTRDAHISPRVFGPWANMGLGLIWHVTWKMPYHILFIIYFNASLLIFVRADRFQKPWLDIEYDAMLSYYIYVFITCSVFGNFVITLMHLET